MLYENYCSEELYHITIFNSLFSSVINQFKHAKQKPVATQETSVKLSKQILKDKKREQVNSESTIVKNIVNENIDTDEKTSESKR